MAVIPTQQINF